MMRNWFAAALATGWLFFLIGCGENSREGASSVAESPAQTSTPLADAAAEDRQFPHAESTAPTPIRPDQGQAPGMGGDKFDVIVDNPFLAVKDSPLSTFSIDVDTASYAKTRTYLFDHRTFPPPDAVRIEELINYFDYSYAPPADERPFAAHIESAECPWRAEHRLVRIGIKGREIDEQRPSSNLVFLLDVSGSMNYPNKLPLMVRGLKLLVQQLDENDRVAIVVYAGAAGLVLPGTHGADKATILDALDRLRAGGSTNGGQGIQLAYQTALENFIPGGVNRVILCTDGDFNVGTTSTGELVRLAETNAKTGVYLSVLGFGMGNLNDAMLEQLSNKANGNYAFIDTDAEAYKVLVQQMSATLVTIAKDVKIQVEFNPAFVAAYRLIGYENRALADRDFNDDKKDAGEIGAGHTVTALYELTMSGEPSYSATAEVDPLKYQQQRPLSPAAGSGELLNLKLRYKLPDSDESTLVTYPVSSHHGKRFSAASPDFQFAAAVASFGMLLRNSPHKGGSTYDAVLEIAGSSLGRDQHGYRAEFLRLVQTARQLDTPRPSVGYAEPPSSLYEPPRTVRAVVPHQIPQPQEQLPQHLAVASGSLSHLAQSPVAFALGIFVGLAASSAMLILCVNLLYRRPNWDADLKSLGKHL